MSIGSTDFTPWSQQNREIDNHYNLMIMSNNIDEIKKINNTNFENQLKQLKTLKNINESINDNSERFEKVSNQFKNELKESFNEINESLLESNELLNDLISIGDESIRLSENIITTLEGGFFQVASELMTQTNIMNEINNSIKTPYKTQFIELLNEAEKSMKKVLNANNERERAADLKDSLNLFQVVVENPVGHQNYIAWFNLGYLNWKFLNEYKIAEEAFFNAARYSAESKNLFYYMSIRHQAYMHYFLGNNVESYNLINKILEKNDDFNIIYDGARYASLVGEKEIAEKLLCECIRRRPHTIFQMFFEKDFKS